MRNSTSPSAIGTDGLWVGRAALNHLSVALTRFRLNRECGFERILNPPTRKLHTYTSCISAEKFPRSTLHFSINNNSGSAESASFVTVAARKEV